MQVFESCATTSAESRPGSFILLLLFAWRLLLQVCATNFKRQHIGLIGWCPNRQNGERVQVIIRVEIGPVLSPLS